MIPPDEARGEREPLRLGWREWVALPSLGLPAIKAKVDTGARTSALHAFYVEPFRQGGAPWVRFGIHPLRHHPEIVVHAEAPVVDHRLVSDSGGHREGRFVIVTDLSLAGREWPAELTLTNRETMLFRMLLGRTAIAGRALVDPRRSFLTGRRHTPADAYTSA